MATKVMSVPLWLSRWQNSKVMKQFLFTALLIMCPLAIVNATELWSEPADSVKQTDAPKSEKGKVVLKGYFDLGFSTMVDAPKECDFRLWPSFEIAIGLKTSWQPFGNKNVWGVGFGVDWRGYRMDNGTYWVKDPQGNPQLFPYAPGQTDCKTRLSQFSLQVPVTYTHYFDKDQGWGLTLGGVVNFNTGAHATREYESLGEEYEVVTGSLHHRPVTVDALVMINTPADFAIYCKYCPMEFFKDGYGYKMHQLSFGIHF